MSNPVTSRGEPRRFTGTHKQALETGRNRLLVAAVMLTMLFAAIGVRLVDLTVMEGGRAPALANAGAGAGSSPLRSRASIVDRNGVVLATSLPTASLYADPKLVFDPEDAADQLAAALPGLDFVDALSKLRSNGRFVWLMRNLTPDQQFEVNRLGIPGVFFDRGERRVYPHGRLAAHVLGLTNVDGAGIAGVERHFDARLKAGDEPVRLSLDIRIQAILREEVATAVEEFRGIGGAGIIIDARTGEVVAMTSLPDFDPNEPNSLVGDLGFNRATKGVYEMGSTFKLFTAAMALNSGTVTLRDGYDASEPIRVSRFTIRDFHAKNRWLSVPEIILYSSNIGAAKMALDIGTELQRTYLDRMGLLAPASIELPEVGKPLVPGRWRRVNTMTISFGHGIAVSPLQLTAGVASIVNGGLSLNPTLLADPEPSPIVEQVISAETSRKMRALMRLVVKHGTGRKADAKGYMVGGKTGTAEKLKSGSYDRQEKISSFVGAFPMDDPRYVVLVMVDEPKGNKRTFNYATGGWVAAPAVSRVVRRMAPIVGIAPDLESEIETPHVPSVKAAQPVRRPAKRELLQKAAWKQPPNHQTVREEQILLGIRQAATAAHSVAGKQDHVERAARRALEQEIAVE